MRNVLKKSHYIFIRIVSYLCENKVSWLGELLLRLSNLIITRSYPAEFKYIQKNVWLHKQGDWSIKYLIPDVRFSSERLSKDINSIYFFKYTPKMGDTCVEVGADIGLESVYMSKLVGASGQLYAIEAAPDTFYILQQNIADNCSSNVLTLNIAISDCNEKVNISASKNNHISNTIMDVNAINEKWYQVDGKTIDDFITENDINKIDYLKVNIEGAESLLINSFSKIRIVKNIAISCHDFLGNRTGEQFYFTRKKVEDFLKMNDFTLYYQSTGIDSVDDWIYGINEKYN